MEVQRKVMVLQQRVKELENENGVLRQRLSDALSGKIDVEQYMRQNGISDMLQVTEVSNGNSSTSVALTNGNISPQSNAVPPVPPRSINNNGDFLSGTSPNETKATPSVGTRLEGLLLNEMENDFDPRANIAGSPTSPPLLAPPPKPARDASRRAQNPDDIFGLSPFKATPRPAGQSKILSSDPFGMGDFGQTGKNGIENDIGLLDKRIKEMKDGFSRGLAMSTEDFSLDSLDPLKK